MSLIEQIGGLVTGLFPHCRVPDDPAELEAITSRGDEASPEKLGASPAEVEGLWSQALDLYKTGMHPAIQLCVRRSGHVVLDRAIGHSSGNGPDDDAETPKRVIGLDSPVNLFSASKAITAMVVHKLDEKGVLRLDDWVCEYLPDFARHGKHRITLRHVLAHRAGVPNLPPESIDLDLLGRPEAVLELLCDAELQSRPGRMLAYHAVTGGFILGEVVRKATGKDLRTVLREEIAEPLGLHWMNYGVDPEQVSEVALNAYTGPANIPPLTQLLRRALGVGIPEIVDLSNDPRFLTGVIPSANVITTARETAAFYQCLLDEGEFEGQRVFAPRTVRHATSEQSWWELDLTLMAPIRYGLGFMLGNKGMGPFGKDNPEAFGHIGLSNIFTWADPERQLAVALLTTGKPLVAPHVVPLFGLLNDIGRVFPRVVDEAAA
jgi:CubicO group peptidase (beta-lactamase class C family)